MARRLLPPADIDLTNRTLLKNNKQFNKVVPFYENQIKELNEATSAMDIGAAKITFEHFSQLCTEIAQGMLYLFCIHILFSFIKCL